MMHGIMSLKLSTVSAKKCSNSYFQLEHMKHEIYEGKEVQIK